MSYHRPHRYLARYRPRMALSGVTDVVETAVKAANDPYLSETICRINQLDAIDSGGAVPGCPTTPANLPGGVGLRKAMPPLRAYIYAEQHKWVYVVAAAGLLGLPFLIGYELGKGGD